MTDKAKANNHTNDELREEKDEMSGSTEAHSPKEGVSSEEEKSENDNSALTELQTEYDKLNDKYLRLYSEFENFRRRTAKERLDLIKNAGSDLVNEILPVIDDFERAIASNEQNADIDTVKEGFKIIHNKLYHILENRGLKPMNSLNEPFDTEYHEAITNIPAPSEDLKGKVVDVAEKGYFFNDRVLRYAKVIVGQ